MSARSKMNNTWHRPPRHIIEKVEALLDLGKSDAGIRNHYTLAEYDITEAQVAEMREDWQGSREWEVRRHLDYTKPPAPSSSSPYRTSSPYRSPPGHKPASATSSRTASPQDPPSHPLKGGPRNWPPEVIDHIQTLLELGWSSSKVANHYSLQAYGLSDQQVELARQLPVKREYEPYRKKPPELTPKDAEQIKRLILEGKTNTAVLNHFSLVDSGITEPQVASIRTLLEKRGSFSPPGAQSPQKPSGSVSKIKPPQLSRHHITIIRSLVEEGRSNPYICNFHALCDLSLHEYQIEGVRRSMVDEMTAAHSPSLNRSLNRSLSPTKSPGRYSLSPAKNRHNQSVDEETQRQKVEHKERLRRKTADKMRRQRMMLFGSQG